MKYIKYDDRGKQTSSEESKISLPDKPKHLEEKLQTVEPVSYRHLLRGGIVGLAAGLPLGALVELVRIILGNPWDDFIIGGTVAGGIILLSVGIAFFYHRAQ